LTLKIIQKQNKRMNTSRQTVLVTGASTGIGKSIVQYLAESGHQVFGSVRSAEDAKSLEELHPGIVALRFDVTDEAAIKNALAVVQEKRNVNQPFSLINNAGIAVPGPLEDLPLHDLRRQFEVNVFGVLRVTQIFLPLIRESQGRIINMSSVAGLMTSPFLGAYSASKFALEALSNALRHELSEQNVKVLLIEPGLIQTPIWEKGLTSPTSQVSAHYQIPLKRFMRSIERRLKGALSTDAVTDAVACALFEEDPPVRQVVASLAMRLQIEIGSRLPTKIADRLLLQDLFKQK
jgi:NAD(P)-dependent dehydrogenase (short-subunit alcohol dehydrogenase family)